MSKMKEYLAEMQACEDMADVCELAHNRTVAHCKELGIDVRDDEEEYSEETQEIFNKYYDEIINHTGI